MTNEAMWRAAAMGLERLEPRMLLAADLFGTFIDVPDGDLLAGSKHKTKIVVENIGAMATDGRMTINFYLSLDMTLDGGDTLVGQRDNVKAKLDPGDTVKTKTKLFLGDGLAAAAYFLLAEVDANDDIPETVEGNNITISPTLLEVVEPSMDLGIDVFADLPASLTAGQTVKFDVGVSNVGNLKLRGPISFDWYASTDGVLDGGDELVAQTDGGKVKLKPGRDKTLTQEVSVLPGLLPNVYQLIAVADFADDDADNNVAVTGAMTNVAAPPPVGPSVIEVLRRAKTVVNDDGEEHIEYRTDFVDVNDWLIRLRGKEHRGGKLSLRSLVRADQKLIVMDYSALGDEASAFSRRDILSVKFGQFFGKFDDQKHDGEKHGDFKADFFNPANRRVVAAYISLAGATDDRSYWDPRWTTDGMMRGELTDRAPDFLGDFERYSEAFRRVRYWDPQWREILFNDAGTGWLDRIVKQGFDAAYMDMADEYEYWRREPNFSKRQAAQAMADLIIDMVSHARTTNPFFFAMVKNGDKLLGDLHRKDHDRREAYMDAVGGVIASDLFFVGDREINNRFRPDRKRVDMLTQNFALLNKPVFSLEFVTTEDRIAQHLNEAIASGFYAFTANNRLLNMKGESGFLPA